MSTMKVQSLSVMAGDFQLGPFNLTVPSASYTVVLGPSGSGKTLFLESIAGHHKLLSGRVTVHDEDITGFPVHRRPIAMVQQQLHLFPHLTIWKNIAYGWRPDPSKSVQVKTDEILEIAHSLDISHLLGRMPGSLSGGEAQRVALARAIMTKPAVLLLDEPLSALDMDIYRNLIGLLQRIHDNGLTMLHVTHDYREALALADHVAVLNEGKLLQSGPVEEVFGAPNHPFLARLTGRGNAFFGTIIDKDEPLNGMYSVKCGDCTFVVAGKKLEVTHGVLSFLPEDVFLARDSIRTSALNVFSGTILDMVKNEKGIEVRVNIGISVIAQLTRRSASNLDLHPGSAVQIAIKATALQFTGGTI